MKVSSSNLLGSSQEWELLFDLAKSLTGNAYTPQQKEGLLKNNFSRRIRRLNLSSIIDYLELVETDENEIEQFLSLATIHTTSWFREKPHYEGLEEYLRNFHSERNGRPFQMLVTACSTGQEAYSFALYLERFRETNPGFDYRIQAFDIDPVSVQEASKAVYRRPMNDGEFLPFKKYMMMGKGKATGYFTFSKEIRARMKFSTGNLLEFKSVDSDKFDWITCRNVLIYFKPQQIEKIVSELAKSIQLRGRLCFGHSDAIEAEKLGIKSLGRSLYEKVLKSGIKSSPTGTGQQKQSGATKILVVDDSKVIREKLTRVFSSAKMEVTAVGSTAEADQAIRAKAFDVISLDLQLPGESGIEWAIRIRKLAYKIPIILVSDSTPSDAPQILEVLGKEIQDFFDKKTLNMHSSHLVEKCEAFIKHNESVSNEKVNKKRRERKTNRKDTPDLILIGASTGGTTALSELLRNFPKPTPPIVIVQHITPNFAEPFAKRLAEVAGLKIVEPRKGLPLEKNHLYMAYGDYHIGVKEDRGSYFLDVSEAAPMTRHRPSVDFLFHSGAKLIRTKITAALLTGMGADGAQGLLALHRKGAFTICQDQDSCIVFGMPREAIQLGAAEVIGNLREIREELEEELRSRNETLAA